MNTKSFSVPERVLMGPGPSNVHPRVLNALSKKTIGHLDPSFIDLMDEIKDLLKYAFKTENDVTFPVSAPGSAGMETCLVNLIEPGDQVAVCQNGVFAGRMKEIVARCGAIPIMVYDDWGKAVSADKLEETLKNNPDINIAAFVHAETSTGVLSDIKTLTEIAHKYNCLTIVDTVTSLGGSPLYIDDWNLDAVYSGTQKCLSCPPGLSPVTFNEKAVYKIKNRKSIVQSWFMDLNLVLGYWNSGAKRSYHHTAPINSLYGLHEALVLLKEEGIEKSWQRHIEYSNKLVIGLESFGLKPFVEIKDRLPQLVSVIVPEGINEAEVRNFVLDKYNLEIGAGLGVLAGKVWRIGLMGHSSNEENINLCLNAIKEAVKNQNK